MTFCRRLYISCCLMFILHYAQCRESKTVKFQDIADRLKNDPLSTWKADDYGMKEYDVEEFRQTKLGVIVRQKKKGNNLTPEQMIQLARVTPADTKSKLPQSFSWADKEQIEKTGGCPIDTIRDQSNCGSCWAVSTAAVLSDRFCIQTKGNIKTPLSQEYIVSCDKRNWGCDGGFMDTVNNYTMHVGVITGGEYESDEGCQPYGIMPCQYPRKKPCAYRVARTPKCRDRKCTNEWYEHKVEPEKNVFKTKKWWFIEPNSTHTVEEIAQDEIIRNGPLSASFLVPYDFLFYKSGVYIPPKYKWYISGHAVRVVGWGVEKGVKYWHVANSWSTEWGEDGFFKIIRGVNACYFEEEFSVLVPAIKK